MVQSSIISIKVLCDKGWKVIYEGHKCNVYCNEKLVWKGIKEPTTELWVLPLYLTQANIPHTKKPTTHTTKNTYTINSKNTLIKWLHQCLFISPNTTLIKAYENNQFAIWPCLTANKVKGNFPYCTLATDKGHMKRQCQGLWSTKEKLK